MLRAEREPVEIGLFLAAFHRTSDMIWMNYAVPIAPTDDAATVQAALPLLRAEFRRRNRVLRFEYLAAMHPTLAAELELFGLSRQLAAPLMTATSADVRSTAPKGCTLQQLTADAADSVLADFLRVGKLSFGAAEADATVAPQEISDLRDAIRQDRWHCLLACCDHRPIGVGTFCTGNCELAGVGTLPDFRRRGIAAAVSSSLLAGHFAAGGDWAWLSAGDEIARALYAKVGFQDAGVQLNYIDAAESQPAG